MNTVVYKGISVFCTALSLCMPAAILADISLDLKSQAVSLNSSIDNGGISLKIGPFPPKKGEFFLRDAITGSAWLTRSG